MGLLERFSQGLLDLNIPVGPALVAVSGGPDSVALLDLLVGSRDAHGLDLIVAHVDHGIHPDSAWVARGVEALAASYGLPFETGCLALGPGMSETSARVARYAWLEGLCHRVGASVIFTGHHAGDQIETVLMRVLRGSGPAGLAGMGTARKGLVRPLLSITRAELAAYLEGRSLSTWLDPANSDPRHLRSWIRTTLLPALRDHVPDVDANLQRVSRQAARDRVAWDTVLDVLPQLDFRPDCEGISVAAASLGGYDSPLAEAVILAAARRAGCQLGPSRVGRVLSLVKRGVSGARVPLGGAWTAELAFGRLRVWRTVQTPDPSAWALDGFSGLGSWGRWSFRWAPAMAPEQQERTGMSAWFTSDPLTVRSWSPGEKVKPLGGNGRRLVVRCFQEVRVPRSRRVSWPVLAQDQEIIWIPGVCRSDALLPAAGTEALRVDAEYA